jgi:hypothetical protein
MKEFIQKYQKAIVGTGALSVLLICYFQQKELSKLRKENNVIVSVPKVDSLQKVIDSLDTELFMAKTMNGRYELALEHLHEVNQPAGLVFQRYMENETE